MVSQPLLLYCVHALVGFERQALLSTLVAESCWRFDMASGQVSFGEAISGRPKSSAPNRMKPEHGWSWANKKPAISHEISLGPPRHFVSTGSITDAVHYPQFELGEIDGHMLAMIASGVCQSKRLLPCRTMARCLLTDPG